MAESVKSIALSKLENIKHGFFTRNGGVSNGIYKSLNCGIYSNDKKDNIFKNRALACKGLSEQAQLIEIHQTHSNKVHVFNNHNTVPEADAIVTDQKNIALSIVTADCAPVLFADNKNSIIGAAHAGWKGAYSGILENTIAEMCKLGASKENIVAAIGPCIAQKSYEVGPEFFKKFRDKQYFTEISNAGFYQFNLETYVSDKLLEAGVKNIDFLNKDTYPPNNGFFSYRRKTHLNEDDYGRQISIIIQN